MRTELQCRKTQIEIRLAGVSSNEQVQICTDYQKQKRQRMNQRFCSYGSYKFEQAMVTQLVTDGSHQKTI